MRLTFAAILLLLLPLAAVTAEESEVYEVFELNTIPVMVDTGSPCYPDSAYKSRTEGAVLVDVVIDKNGKVEKAEVFDSDPKGVFEAAALEAAQLCSFEPILREGEAVKVKYRIPFIFSRSNYNLKPCSKVRKK